MNIGIDPHTYATMVAILQANGLLVRAGDGIGIVLGTVTFYPDDGSTAIPGSTKLIGDP